MAIADDGLARACERVSNERAFRVGTAVVGIFALSVQYGLLAIVTPDLPSVTCRFLCFFTFWTNLIAAMAMLIPALWPTRSMGRAFASSRIRLVIAGNLLVVGLVFHFALRGPFEPTWEYVSDVLLHYVVPALFVLDWLIFVPRTRISWRFAAFSIVLPVAYGTWAFSYGFIANWYPYPFLEAGTLSAFDVIANVGALLALFVAASALLIAIDRKAMRFA